MTRSRNPLVAAVAPFDHRTRQALYAASQQPLKRRTWDGCALDRAAAWLGRAVKTTGEAEEVFGASHRDVVRFIGTWDRIRDDDKRSTLLREALLVVGLFPMDDHLTGEARDDRPAGVSTAAVD